MTWRSLWISRPGLHGRALQWRSLCVAAVVCSIAAGCGGEGAHAEDGDGPPPPPSRPDELGPFAIGVTTIETPDGGPDGRVLPIEVWYPAQPVAGAVPEEYQLMLGALKLAEMTSPLEAVRDSPFDTRGAPYPVVLFSHGNGGVRIQSLYLTEYLASHGFVVAAPDHVGNTLTEQVNEANALPPAEAARLRPLDISRVLDTLLAGNDTQGSLIQLMLDPDRVGVAGHSFGGYTALRVAGATVDDAAAKAECAISGGLICDGWQDVSMPSSQGDPRVVAALPQAPGGAQAFFAGGRNGYSDVRIPVMVHGGTTDETTPYEAESVAPFEALPGSAWLLTIQNAGHFTYSDMCLLVERMGLTVDWFDDGCGQANIPYREAQEIARSYATAFMQMYVAGERAHEGFLDPSAVLRPDVASLLSRP